MSADLQNPWLGLIPYGEGDAPYFHGRLGETGELFALLERDVLSVLYGVSGLGKTSLLRAGLFPRLRERDYLPTYLRIDHAAPESAEATLAEVPGNTDQYVNRAAELGISMGQMLDNWRALSRSLTAQVYDAPSSASVPTLWEYYHHRDHRFWSAKNRPLTPILVFDQFEEIFTLGQQNPARVARTAAFLDELSALIANRPPEHVRAAVERGEEVPFDFEPVPLRVVLALREDFLPHLAQLREHGFPTIRRNEMRLLPMSTAAAREVIEIPGRDLLEPGLADEILTFLAGRSTGSVEPALLSVVLRELNEKRLAQRLPHITAELLSGSKDAILSDFYERAFAELDGAVRLFVEDELVTQRGFRDSRDLDDALSRHHITQEALDLLVDRRLLRYEDRSAGGRRIELTHDLLCGVTVASRTARKTQEAEAQLLADEERKRRDAEELAATQHRQLIRTRRLAVAFAVLGLLAVAALVFAVDALRRAQMEKVRAQVAEQRAEQALRQSAASEQMARDAKDKAVLAKKDAEASEQMAKEAKDKAVLAKKDAETSEQMAKEAKDKAVLAKKDAEGLINYMQYDLRDGLGKLGYSNLMQGINARVRQYYDAHPADSDDLSAQRERSVAITQMGDLLTKQGDNAAALRAYQESQKIDEALLEKEPDKPTRQRDLAITYVNVGDVLSDQKDLAGALEAYQKSFELRQKLAEKNPNDKEAQSDLALGYQRIGNVLYTRGELAEALKSYQANLDLLKKTVAQPPPIVGIGAVLKIVDDFVRVEELVAEGSAAVDGRLKPGDRVTAVAQGDGEFVATHGLPLEQVVAMIRGPADASVRLEIIPATSSESAARTTLKLPRSQIKQAETGRSRDLSTSYNKVGYVYRDLGNLPKALESFREGLSWVENLAKQEPDTAGWKSNLATSHANVGDVLRNLNDQAGALEAYQKAFDIRVQLTRRDPENKTWQWDVAITHERIGDVQSAQGRTNEALKSYQAEYAMEKQLIASSPGNGQWQRDFSPCCNRLGNALAAKGDLQAALDIYQEGLRTIQKFAERDPSNLDLQANVTWSHTYIGDVLQSRGDLPGALDAYRNALSIREKLVQHNSAHTTWRWNLAAIHNKVGWVLFTQGDFSGALQSYQLGLDLMDALVKQDPAHLAWKRDLAASYAYVGLTLNAQNDQPGALRNYEQNLVLLSALTQQDSGNAGLQAEFEYALNRVGDVLRVQNDLPGSLAKFREAMEIAKKLADQDATNASSQRDLGICGNKVGDVLLAQGDSAGALRMFRDAHTVGRDLARRDPSNAVWQGDLAYSMGRVAAVLITQSADDRTEGRTLIADALTLLDVLAEKNQPSAWQKQIRTWLEGLRDKAKD